MVFFFHKLVSINLQWIQVNSWAKYKKIKKKKLNRKSEVSEMKRWYKVYQNIENIETNICFYTFYSLYLFFSFAVFVWIFDLFVGTFAFCNLCSFFYSLVFGMCIEKCCERNSDINRMLQFCKSTILIEYAPSLFLEPVELFYCSKKMLWQRFSSFEKRNQLPSITPQIDWISKKKTGSATKNSCKIHTILFLIRKKSIFY